MGAFSFRRDFGEVQWGRTIWLNLLRAFCAGIVWGVVILIMSFSYPPRAGAMPWYALPFTFLIGSLFILPIYLAVGKVFAEIFGGLGELTVRFANMMFGLILVVGDPLVFILHRTIPALVPTKKFKFLNFSLVYLLNKSGQIGEFKNVIPCFSIRCGLVSMKLPGLIEKLHFDEPIGNRSKPRGMAQHYIGYAIDLTERLQEHANGCGARIMAAVVDCGIGWQVVCTWLGGRKDERKLKNCKKARRFCPVCSKKIC